MIIYQNNEIKVRTLESKDQEECLMLYSQQKCGLNQTKNQILEKITEEEQTMRSIIENKTTSTQYLILESQNKILGYASISKLNKKIYCINHIRIQPYLMSEKYGMLLLDIIKKEALQDECSIECDPQDNEDMMLIRSGFNINNKNCYFISSKEIFSSIGKNLIPIFEKTHNKEERPKVKVLN